MSDEKPKFNRGSALSIFGSDRREDLMALVIALLIALPIFAAEWTNDFVEIPYLSLLAKILGVLFFIHINYHYRLYL